MKLQICVIRIRTQELQRERSLHVHDPTNTLTLSSSPLFGVSQRRSQCEAFFFRRGRQSAPCSQALSSHFTRSTRWNPRELLYFPIGPFCLGSCRRETPGFVNERRQRGRWRADKYLSTNTQTDSSTHTRVSPWSQTAAWRRRPPNINEQVRWRCYRLHETAKTASEIWSDELESWETAEIMFIWHLIFVYLVWNS